MARSGADGSIGLDDDDDQGLLAAGLRYYEFPRLHLDDAADLVELCRDADIVVFDAQRMFLTDLGLQENVADDYARFIATAIDPLFRAGIATAILDNTGHEGDRARGSSTKGDLNEILFTLKAVEKFDTKVTGLVQLTVKDTRFGNRGVWEMRIGGGTFEPWRPTEAQWRPTELMERASRALEVQARPASRTEVVSMSTGNRAYLFQAVEFLIQDGYADETPDHFVTSVKPYRNPASVYTNDYIDNLGP